MKCSDPLEKDDTLGHYCMNASGALSKFVLSLPDYPMSFMRADQSVLFTTVCMFIVSVVLVTGHRMRSVVVFYCFRDIK